MSNNDGLYIRTGFVPDKASNALSVAELEKVKQKVLDVQKSIKDTSSTKLNITDTAGGIGGAAGKIRGVATLLGGSAAGDIAGLVNDIGDAFEGFQQLKVALTGVQVAQTAATATQTAAGAAAATAGASTSIAAAGFTGVSLSLLPLLPILLPLAAAAIAVGVAVKAAVDGIQSELARLDKQLNAERSAVEAAFSGTTVSEAKAQIDKFNESIAAQTELLKRNEGRVTQAFGDLVKAKEQVFGVFGDLAARLQVFFGLSKVGEYQQEVDKSKTARDDAIIAEKEWQEELDAGSFKADAAAKAEAKLSESRASGTKTADNTAREAEAAREKAQQEAEQRAQEAEQLRQQQADMAARNVDSIKRINQTAVDSIKDIQQKARDAAIDGRNKFITDLNNLTQKNNDDELGATIKANQAEQKALKEHQRTIQNLIDQAADAEEDARDNRNFLQLVQARRDAQKEINKEPENFKQGAEDREAAFEDERAERMRQFEIARRDTRQAYQQEDAERRAGIERALRDNQTNKTRQLRDQAAAYQAEQAMFNRHNQDKLGMLGQFMSAEMSMLQGAMNGMRGGGSRSAPASPLNMFNNSRTTNNTTNNFSPIGTGGMMGALRVAGFGRR